jgi:hypothetical protein
MITGCFKYGRHLQKRLTCETIFRHSEKNSNGGGENLFEKKLGV